MKNLVFGFLFIGTSLFSQVDSSNLASYRSKGNDYAILNYKKVSNSNAQIVVVYSNEKNAQENLNEKFKMSDDTTSFSSADFLMLGFKYLNAKGYELASSTSEFFEFKLANSLHKEFYFVKQK